MGLTPLHPRPSELACRGTGSATHVSDAAHLFKLALEKIQPGARYYAIGEEGIAFRHIAVLIGQTLGIPAVSMSSAEAAIHFSWLTAFGGKDTSASSKKTRSLLVWEPVEQGLLADPAQIDEQ